MKILLPKGFLLRVLGEAGQGDTGGHPGGCGTLQACQPWMFRVGWRRRWGEGGAQK